MFNYYYWERDDTGKMLEMEPLPGTVYIPAAVAISDCFWATRIGHSMSVLVIPIRCYALAVTIWNSRLGNLVTITMSTDHHPVSTYGHYSSLYAALNLSSC